MLRVIKSALKAGERAVNGVSQRRSINDAIKSLEPWYQPINFGYGISTKAVDKGGNRITYRSMDRGINKWKHFIKPSLPFDLKNKRVLEVGCNAGLFLAECVREGAREAVGIEKDDHYYSQARFVARTFSQLEGRYYPVRVYQGAMESFPYEGLGRFDLAMFSGLHIPHRQVGRLRGAIS
jgi:SAM-dependent methyltransferase